MNTMSSSVSASRVIRNALPLRCILPNKTGAKVIAITDSISSPLVRSADYFLQARSDMASFVDSMVAPLSLINALIVAIGLKKQDEMKKTFDRLEQIWDAYDVFDKSGGTNG